MATCVHCGEYFRVSPWNSEGKACENCVDTLDEPMYDAEDQVEVDMLMNPTGVTQAVFYDQIKEFSKGWEANNGSYPSGEKPVQA